MREPSSCLEPWIKGTRVRVYAGDDSDAEELTQLEGIGILEKVRQVEEFWDELANIRSTLTVGTSGNRGQHNCPFLPMLRWSSR